MVLLMASSDTGYQTSPAELHAARTGRFVPLDESNQSVHVSVVILLSDFSFAQPSPCLKPRLTPASTSTSRMDHAHGPRVVLEAVQALRAVTSDGVITCQVKGLVAAHEFHAPRIS